MIDAAHLIRTARRNAGLTQSALADRLGVTQPVIARLEGPGANPRLSTLADLVEATGHSLKLELDRESGIDETMIAAELSLTADERLRRFEQFYEFASAAGTAAPQGG